MSALIADLDGTCTAPAVLAALQATEAAAALLTHAREGDGFGDVATVEKLAEALSLTIDLNLDLIEDCDLEYRALLEDLRDRCKTFIEGWAG